MTYSKDFRQKVLAYKDDYGLTFDETSDHFDIGVSSLYRWCNQLEPCETRDKPSTKVNMDELQKDVDEFPDDYQWERAQRLGVGQPAIHYALKRLKITVKKNSTTS
mgnify:CR=1 FL=1